jgi:hypothetical protein
MANGEICHIEIFSKDLKTSKKFYEDIFGWEVKTELEGIPNYATFMDKGDMGGGFTDEVEGIFFYIEVDDIDETLKQIENAGGKTEVPKTRISDEIGYAGIFTDPSGTRIGLWSKK